MKRPSDLSTEFAAIVGAANLQASDALAASDPGFDPGNISGDLAVFPETIDHVAQIVALCAQHGIAIVPQGGRTGLSGAASAGSDSIVLGLKRMTEIEAIDPLAATARVECGATLQSVEEAANQHGLSVGIDLGARGSATIGGMISTNAGGMEAFRNGSMRNRVLGLEAVLASGAVLNDMTEVPKCNEGYDIKHLLCGAEGTLGIVTRAVLRLTPQTHSSATLLVACASAADALTIKQACQSLPALDLLQCEIMWRAYAQTVAAHIGLTSVLSFCDAPAYLLLELASRDGDIETAIESLFSTPSIAAAMQDAIVAKNERERGEIWRIREESFVIDQTISHCSWYDISVPLDRIDETVAQIETRLHALDPQIGIWVMGHLGDGNLHYTIGTGKPLSDERKAEIADAVYSGLKQIGGAFSAEHGIGTEKRASLASQSDPEKLRLMREIKRVFDPQGIMNPGKVL